MEVRIIRHAQALHNLKKILDENPKNKTFLTNKGIHQARKTAQKFKKQNLVFDVIYSSQFPRVLQTARIIRRITQSKRIAIDKRINERKTGMDKKPVSAWKSLKRKNNPFLFKLPRGESFQEEKKRIKSFLKSIKEKKHHLPKILIVTHGEPMQIVRGLLKHLSDQKMMKRNPQNAEVWKFEM